MRGKHRSEWTVLLYMGAVEEDDAKSDQKIIDGLRGAKLSSEVSFVYQLGAATHTSRGTVRGDPAKVEVLAHGPAVDITRARSLTSFLDWAREQFPAQRTALILKDHGGGVNSPRPPPAERPTAQEVERPARAGAPQIASPLSILFDPRSGKYLGNQGLRTAVSRSHLPHLDVYGFDACWMGMVEIAYEVREVASFLVASQSLEVGDWSYRGLLESLSVDPQMGARTFAETIVTTSSTPTVPLAAFELEWMDSLSKLVDDLAAGMLRDLDSVARRLKPLRKYFNDYVDFVQFLDAVHEVGREDVRKTARRARENFEKARVSPAPADASGATIFFPQAFSRFLPKYGALSFARKNHWTTFIGDFLQVKLAGG